MSKLQDLQNLTSDPAEMEKLPTKRRYAIASGSPYYFTGKPCIREHLRQRMAPQGRCVECEIIAYPIRLQRFKEYYDRFRLLFPEIYRENMRVYRNKQYAESPEFRAYHKAQVAKYQKTEKGKITSKKANVKYQKTEKGKLALARANQKRNMKRLHEKAIVTLQVTIPEEEI